MTNLKSLSSLNQRSVDYLCFPTLPYQKIIFLPHRPINRLYLLLFTFGLIDNTVPTR